MFNRRKAAVIMFAVLMVSASAFAHFQEIIPNFDIINSRTGADIILKLIFTHPMEDGPVMAMEKPVQFGVQVGGEKQDLKNTLTEIRVDGKKAFKLGYKIKRPGDYIFYVEPVPYWEPSEGKMIIHYSKVVVGAYGDESSWDSMIGLPVEIKPLVRPYGLWAGNLFRGIVMKNKKPLPFAEIEVEYVNPGRKVSIPADSFVTQVIKADQNGVFSYAMPRAGWWGFAALTDADKQMKSPEGKNVDVELGGLIWVNCRDMQ